MSPIRVAVYIHGQRVYLGIAPEAGIVSIRQSSANYEFTDPTTNDALPAGNLVTLAKSIMRAADTDGSP